MRGRLVVDVDDGTLCLASHACLATVFWIKHPTPDRIRRISAVQRDMVERYGYCVSLSSVPDKIAVSPDEQTKRATADNLAEFGKTNLGIAVLVPQGGVRATLIRTLLTGIQLLAMSPARQRVFSQVEPALTWLAERPGLRTEHATMLPELGPEVEALLARAYGP